MNRLMSFDPDWTLLVTRCRHWNNVPDKRALTVIHLHRLDVWQFQCHEPVHGKWHDSRKPLWTYSLFEANVVILKNIIIIPALLSATRPRDAIGWNGSLGVCAGTLQRATLTLDMWQHTAVQQPARSTFPDGPVNPLVLISWMQKIAGARNDYRDMTWMVVWVFCLDAFRRYELEYWDHALRSPIITCVQLYLSVGLVQRNTEVYAKKNCEVLYEMPLMQSTGLYSLISDSINHKMFKNFWPYYITKMHRTQNMFSIQFSCTAYSANIERSQKLFIMYHTWTEFSVLITRFIFYFRAKHSQKFALFRERARAIFHVLCTVQNAGTWYSASMYALRAKKGRLLSCSLF